MSEEQELVKYIHPAGRDRNGPCSCGSGRKAKKCCGAAWRFNEVNAQFYERLRARSAEIRGQREEFLARQLEGGRDEERTLSGSGRPMGILY